MISRSIIGQNLLGSFRKCTHLYKIVGSSVSKSVAPFRFYLGALNVFPQILCFSKVSLSFLKAISNFQNGDTCLRFQLVMDRSTDGPADGWKNPLLETHQKMDVIYPASSTIGGKR